MKAWELIKHLEEGGEIKSKTSDAVLKFRNLSGWDYNPVDSPEGWEIVIPKRKVEVECYVQFGEPLHYIGTLYRELGVTCANLNANKDTKVKITLEEL